MTKEQISKFNNDMKILYDTNLDVELKGGANKVDAFCNRVEMVVLQEIKSNNPTYREVDLAQVQQDELWKAMLEQAYYLINNYDMNIVSGFDPIGNSTVPIDEIRKRAFSPLAKQILTNAGLFYRGIGNTSLPGYDRRGWR